MPRIPPAVRVTRDGVTLISGVDRTLYTLKQLNMAGLNEVGKLVRRRMFEQAKLMPGLKKSKRIKRSFQHWVRRRDGDLQVGIKHNTWYGVKQEFGDDNQPKRGILRNSVFEEIDNIRRIMGVYNAAIEDENKAAGLIADDGSWGTGDDEQ